MGHKKLPIAAIFLAAISLPFQHYRLLFKVGLPLIISGSLFIIALGQFSEEGEEATLPAIFSIGLTTIFLVSLVMAVVGCHRIFLMSPNVVEDAKLFHWTGNEIKYAGWWMLIGICIYLVIIPYSFLLIPLMNSPLSKVLESEVMIFLLLGLAYLPLLYIISRWSLVLPSSAIDIHGKSLIWSWRLSEGNGWRLTLLIGILPLIMDILFTLLPVYDSHVFSLFCGAVWLVIGVVEIGLLSLSYAFLVSENHDEPEIASA